MDPQNFGSNWSLCRDLESVVVIEFLVFVAAFYRCLLFPIVTYFLGFYLDSVVTYFDNVTTEFWCNSLVLVATEMSCVMTPNLFAASFSFPIASGICHDIIFLVATRLFLFFIAIHFSSLVLIVG